MRNNNFTSVKQSVNPVFVNAAIPSAIQIYNNKVERYTKQHPLTDIKAQSVILYVEALNKLKLSNKEYNVRVESFNRRNGLYLPKKEVKQVFNSLSTEYNYINLPVSDTETIKQTFSNYTAFETWYNHKIVLENIVIQNYNKTNVLSSQELTDKDKAAILKFKKSHNKDFIKHYNASVEFENLDHPIHKKRKLQKLQPQYKVTFEAFVSFYTAQLRDFTAQKKQLGKSTRILKKEPPCFRLNHYSIARHLLGDNNNVSEVQKKARTIKNHTKILRESGLFSFWKNQGSHRPVFCRFNPKIFVIKEGKEPKQQNTGNHIVNDEKVQKIHYYDKGSTRTYLNKYNKKSNSEEIADKCGSISETLKTSPAVSYKNNKDESYLKNEISPENVSEFLPEFLKNTNADDKTEKKPASSNVFKIKPGPSTAQISENARFKIVSYQILAENLIKNNYEGYKPIKYNHISRILKHSNLDFNELCEFLTQDFVKNTYKIYRDRPDIYVGEWKKAIRRIRDEIFAPFLKSIIYNNDTRNIASKIDIILRKISELRGMLEMVRMNKTKNNINLQYPYQFFNVRATNPKQCCFFGIRKFYSQRLKKRLENKKIETAVNAKVSKYAKKTRQDFLIDNALNKLAKGDYTFEQFYNYIEKYHPTRRFEIAEMIQKNNAFNPNKKYLA